MHHHYLPSTLMPGERLNLLPLPLRPYCERFGAQAELSEEEEGGNAVMALR